MQFRIGKKPTRGLDITPVVDTVFNLLIFFALSLNFVTSPGIQVKLPKASSEEFPAERREIVVAITRDNQIYMDQRRTTEAELWEKLKAVPEDRKRDGMVIIQADERVYHGRVVTVMDLIKRAGFLRLAIATEPEGVER